MLSKQRSRRKGFVKVKFWLPRPEAQSVHLVGDFNDWQTTQPMKRLKGGPWQLALDLQTGREYQFRYFVDGADWVNDPEADKYVANPYGGDNSVVET